MAFRVGASMAVLEGTSAFLTANLGQREFGWNTTLGVTWYKDDSDVIHEVGSGSGSGSLDAVNIEVDTSSFTGILQGVTNNVQAMLSTLDSEIGGIDGEGRFVLNTTPPVGLYYDSGSLKVQVFIGTWLTCLEGTTD